MKQAGWLFLAAGVVVQVAEAMAKAGANSAQGNTTFEETAVGKIVAPIDKLLPVPLGWSLIVTGAILVWAVPHLQG